MPKELVFAIYMGPRGPEMETKMDPRFALRLLAGVAEDMREAIAVDAAKRLLEGERRVEAVSPNGVNGVIVGKSD